MNWYMRPWIALALVIGGCVSYSQSSTWISLAPLNEPRQEVGVAELNGRIYVFGGFREDRTTAATTEVYDPQKDNWSTLEPMPVAVNHPAAVANGGKLFVMGGYQGPGLQNPTDALQVYDPLTREWKLKAPLPTARGGLAAAVVEGRVYAIGGARNSAVGEVASYDPATNVWTSVASLPTSRDHLGAGVVDGKIFAVGGRNGHSFTLDTIEVYDPAKNQWEQFPAMPTGRSGHGVAVLGTCLYAFGGEGNEQDPAGIFAEVEVFSADTQSWTSLDPMPTPRHGIRAVGVGDRIFIPGGATIAGFGATGVHEALITPGCG